MLPCLLKLTLLDCDVGRAEFAEQQIANIRDSANYPLNGQRWWLKADKPWETLAACKEIVAAMDHPGGSSPIK